jgi:hypothetical protein
MYGHRGAVHLSADTCGGRAVTHSVDDSDRTRSGASPNAGHDFYLERYKYILQQINNVNENLYKFLAVYQALATAAVGAAIALFVNYKHWGVAPGPARVGVLALLTLESVVAVFTTLLIGAGVLSWLDYRHEECELTDLVVGPGFRSPPRVANFYRWYETYVVAFIVISSVVMWIFAIAFVLPRIK